MIQEKVRQKKRPALMLIFGTVSQKSRDQDTQYCVCEHAEVF